MPARREWRSRRRSGAAVTTTFVDDPAGDAAANLRLGASIRHLRHARGRTLVQLAEATGLSHPFLSQLERGLAQPSLSRSEEHTSELQSLMRISYAVFGLTQKIIN